MEVKLCDGMNKALPIVALVNMDEGNRKELIKKEGR